MATTAPLTDDLNAPYPVTEAQIRQCREQGFIKLKNVFSPDTLEAYGPEITRLTMAHKPDVPLEQRSTYGKAFIQVGNLWEKSETARALSFSRRLAQIAADLMGTRGTRMWHDQSLYKEPSGGFTPWHADQQYWPMATSKCITAWIPLHAVPIKMGPLCFGKGSHVKNFGRDLEISDDSEKLIREQIKREGIIEEQSPYDLGEVSFHYGWTLHRAGPNTTDRPREVHTVIMMDIDMTLAKPRNVNQENDWHAWTPGTTIGAVMDDPKNPVLFERG